MFSPAAQNPAHRTLRQTNLNRNRLLRLAIDPQRPNPLDQTRRNRLAALHTKPRNLRRKRL
jgi:hypothetical protein